MSRSLTIALLAMASTVATYALARQGAADQDKLEGVWRTLTIEVDGRYLPDEEAEKLKLAVAKDRMLFGGHGKGRLTRFKLDAMASPKTIDLTGVEDEQTALGIYELNGERLKISLAQPGGKKRPTQFATEEIRNVVFTFEHVKLAAGDKSAADLIKEHEGAAPTEAMKASARNLQLLALAIHNYHDQHGNFPQPAIYGMDGKPLLSWRVALLPYLEQEPLYKEFRLDEPWDSKHNKALVERMPSVFAPVRGKTKEPFSTYYCVFTSTADANPGAMFVADPKITLGFASVTDGTSNTMMIVEAAEAVAWTNPGDLVYDPQKPLPKLGGLFTAGFHCCMGDGSTRFFKKDLYQDEPILRALITRNGGEVVDDSKYSER